MSTENGRVGYERVAQLALQEPSLGDKAGQDDLCLRFCHGRFQRTYFAEGSERRHGIGFVRCKHDLFDLALS